MLNGRIVKGQHPALITEKEFLEINNIRAAAKGKFGVYHNKERDPLPLKVFTKCDKCGNCYTGYIVKAKNLYYYKCRTTGCKCNQNASKMNSQFMDFLSSFSLRPELISPFQKNMKILFEARTKNDNSQKADLEINLKEVQEYLENIDEKYHVLETMDTATYQKLKSKYAAKKQEIVNVLGGCKENSSNLSIFMDSALTLSRKLATEWSSSDVRHKETLQNLIFPEGVYYNLEKETFRTNKVNKAFCVIPQLNIISGEPKEREDSIYAILPVKSG